MEIFELKATDDTCTSKFVFRCNVCLNSKVFMSVGEPTSSATTNLLDLTSVLSSRLVGLNSELRTFSSCMDLPPPPSRHYFNKIQKEVLIAAEKEAEASMDRAKTQLETKLSINPITNYVHAAASIVKFVKLWQIISHKIVNIIFPNFAITNVQ